MAEIKKGLCVLITNAFIQGWSGSELYVRDVAMELIKKGHKPVVYSPRLGKLADVFRSHTIPVVQDLNSIDFKPDLIHGQHHLETMTALAHFPEVPAVFFCHGWVPWEEIPPLHPRILHYVTVSDALHDRLIYECGIHPEKITTILNFVDLQRFQPRSFLPEKPSRALVFSNQATETNFLGMIRKACAQNNIDVDVVGSGVGNPSYTPELLLGSYDILFARGRAALEGLATGAAVICCDQEGAGQMVNTQNLNWLRSNNFGIRVLDRPISVKLLCAEIQKYDPLEAQKTSAMVRATAGLDQAGVQIVDTYTYTLDKWAKGSENDSLVESLAVSDYLKSVSDFVYQTIYERDILVQRAAQLQNELNVIKSRSLWKLYDRIKKLPFVRNSYFRLISSLQGFTRKD